MPPKPVEEEGGRPYGGRSPEERRAERRGRLLDAALELYGTAGYRATPVAQVCKAARVAPAKFYEEFASSEALLAALSLAIWEPLRREVLDAMGDRAPDIVAMTRAGVETYCHGLLEDPRRARVLCVELPSASPAALAGRQRQVMEFASLSFAAFQAVTGERRPRRQGRQERLNRRQLEMLANGLVGAIDEVVRFWLLQPEPRPPIDEVVETVMTVYLAVGRYLVSGAPRA
jgi:AcrR family transcriptional regulator